MIANHQRNRFRAILTVSASILCAGMMCPQDYSGWLQIHFTVSATASFLNFDSLQFQVRLPNGQTHLSGCESPLYEQVLMYTSVVLNEREVQSMQGGTLFIDLVYHDIDTTRMFGLDTMTVSPKGVRTSLYEGSDIECSFPPEANRYCRQVPVTLQQGSATFFYDVSVGPSE